MLAGLTIRNVVLVDQLSLSVEPGLTALTGETGAGKSILLDALGLATGGRADASLVRHGAEQATVTAEFALDADHPVLTLASEQGLAVDGPLILRRSLGADGRSRAFVNDQPVSVGLLKQIGGALVEVHGQFDAQGLLDQRTHRGVLDQFGGHGALLGAVGQAWDALVAARRTLDEAAAAAERARAEEEWLRHTLAELDALSPVSGEEAELAQKRALLQNREKLIEALSVALEEIGGESGAERRVAGAMRSLGRLAERSGVSLDGPLGALDRAAEALEEARRDIEAMAADTDLDPRRLEQLEDRLFALRALARKLGTDVDGLSDLRMQTAAKLDLVERTGDRLSELRRAVEDASRRYAQAAVKLSEARRTAAARLDEAVARELEPLKLGRARFVTRVEPIEAEVQGGREGIDRVVFEVATNPGMPSGPINKIASGGELSRFMLAIKVALAGRRGAGSPSPTMIFDEVDAGVGGAVADAVGERLARLARTVQVMVVTHSPQVASRATHHMKVAKSEHDGIPATTTVAELDGAGRREEIARMLSGATVTDEARAAAKRLMGELPL